MSYEPTEKVKAVIIAMAAEPDRIWSSDDVAPILAVPCSQVPSYLETAVRNGKVFRQVGPNGRLQYAGKAFPPPALNVPKFTSGFVPPQMVAPRPGSDVPQPARAFSPPPAAVPPPAVEVEEPQAEPEVELEPGPEEEQVEEAEPVAFNFWHSPVSGELVLQGVHVDEDGDVTLSRQQVLEIRRYLLTMQSSPWAGMVSS